MHSSTIGILYNRPLATGRLNWEASVDILSQVGAVEEALSDRGENPVRIPLTRDAADALQRIREARVDRVVNLCETIEEDPRLAWHSAALLELTGIPFTGSPSTALMLTADKVLTKRLLAGQGIRTPAWRVYDGTAGFDPSGLRFPVLIKPRFEEAGIGIDQESIFVNAERLGARIEDFRLQYGPVFVEEYIGGREFNLSLLGYPEARVLPPAEIDFSDFPDSLYPIVGYRAKWVADSFEFRHTPRRFPDRLNPGLARDLQETAAACFHLLGLRDYGRVDMRVDDRNRVYVLEVNANPCLSPDAGFAAAAERDGMDYPALVNALTGCVRIRMSADDDFFRGAA